MAANPSSFAGGSAVSTGGNSVMGKNAGSNSRGSKSTLQGNSSFKFRNPLSNMSNFDSEDALSLPGIQFAGANNTMKMGISVVANPSGANPNAKEHDSGGYNPLKIPSKTPL